MSVTTTIDGSTAVKYTAGTDLQELANKSGLTVDQILVFADRQNDALEGGVTPLEIGDVIVLKNPNTNNNNTNSAPQKEGWDFSEAEGKGTLGGAAVGAGIGFAVGNVPGAIIGALIGAAGGWIVGGWCE